MSPDSRGMHILLASDGSPAALDAARLIRTVISRDNIDRVTVLTVISPIESSSFFGIGALPLEQSTWDELEGAAEQQARQTVATTVGEIGADMPVHTQILRGIPGNEIVRFAKANSVDLIVMGSRGWGETRALLFGSVSEHVLHSGSCPVLVSPARHKHD